MIDLPAFHYVGECLVFEFPSSSRDNLIHVTYVGKQGAKCTCEGWRYTGHCKHIDQIKLPTKESPIGWD